LENRQSSPVATRETPFGLDLSLAAFDRVTRIAKNLLAADDALIILIENGVAWRSRDPEGRRFDPRDAPAERVIASGKLLWVEDARLDPDLSQEGLVTGPPHLRSYIAAPIRLEDGSTPGVLCTVSLNVQPYDAAKAARLQDLADLVADEWARAKAAQAHKEAARALNVAQTTLEALAETVPIALVMTDRNCRVLAMSRKAPNGDEADMSAIGRDLFEVSPVFEQLRPALLRVLAGRTAEGVQLPLRDAGGARMWVQAQITAWRDRKDAPAGLVITTTDVTELKAALDAAERSEERLNLALALSDIHVWEIDYANRKLYKAGAEDTFFERPQTYDDLYRDIFVTIDERDHPLVKEAWRRHVEEGEPYRPHYRIARTDGKEVWAEGIIRYFADEKGRPLRMVGALRNITAAKQAEQKLMAAIAAAEAANTAKSQFLATMSHEIRTPMNGVLGMAQAMEADELSPTQRVRLGVIRESGQSLLTILNDVLDISKIEAGKLELEAADFEIDEIAEGVRQAFAAIADAKNLQLILEVAPQARGVYCGDATRVRQILSNLISNALKFTEKGSVTVKVQRVAGRLRLSVSDTGIGIARADMRRLFEKFEQADASTTRRFGGSGLGLAICRQLAEMMGGRIQARSRVGEGSAFVVSLPLEWRGRSERKTGETKAPEPSIAEPRGLRVLAAEDNEINQLVLKTLLGQLGLEPVVVADGAAALAAWRREDWDVILMDVQMPRMDGPTATREIRRRETELGRPRTPIVALTANAMAHQVEEYRAAGMDDFVAKPIEVGELFAALQRAVERADEAAAA